MANVRDQVSQPAFGTTAYSAGEMPEVPKAQGLGGLAQSTFL